MRFADMKRVYEKLEDEKSKKVYDMWTSFAMGKSELVDFYELVKEDALRSPEFERWYCNVNKPIVIFGTGTIGKYTYQLLHDLGYNVVAFVDSNWNNEKKNEIEQKFGGEVKLIDFEELHRHVGEWCVVIGSSKFRLQMWEQLLRMNIPQSDILYPPYEIIRAWNFGQYFDFFEPKEKEIFVDGGVLDGTSTKYFANWAGTYYEKTYLFEANPLCTDVIQANLSSWGISNYELISKAMAECEKTIRFDGSYGGGSRESEQGSFIVPANSLDNELAGRPVTLIKMDLEGGERAALEGCKETIKKYKPRLAISIYHKIDDYITIPLQILDMVPEYKFAMRHYCTLDQETVLYGWVE